VILVTVTLRQVVDGIRGCLQHGDTVGVGAVECQRAAGRPAAVGHSPPALNLLDCIVAHRPVGPHRAVYAVATGTVGGTVRAAAVRLFGVRRVSVSVEAAPDQRVSGHFALAYECVALEYLDAGSPAQYGCEQWRVVGVRGPGKR